MTVNWLKICVRLLCSCESVCGWCRISQISLTKLKISDYAMEQLATNIPSLVQQRNITTNISTMATVSETALAATSTVVITTTSTPATIALFMPILAATWRIQMVCMRLIQTPNSKMKNNRKFVTQLIDCCLSYM